MILTGILGGSFNPAHRGHRRISLQAIEALGLDEMWWLVSPGNPLKEGKSDMAPLPMRLASANRMARRSRIVPTAIEARLGTRYTADTLRRLVRLYPNRRFIWLMGGRVTAVRDLRDGARAPGRPRRLPGQGGRRHVGPLLRRRHARTAHRRVTHRG